MIDRYDSTLDADYSPSELSGEDDPLEYDSQTEEPEPRFCEPFEVLCRRWFTPRCLVLSLCFLRFVEVAEAEVVEGDLGEEADSVEIRTEDYSSTGDKK